MNLSWTLWNTLDTVTAQRGFSEQHFVTVVVISYRVLPGEDYPVQASHCGVCWKWSALISKRKKTRDIPSVDASQSNILEHFGPDFDNFQVFTGAVEPPNELSNGALKSWPHEVLPQKSGRLLHCLVKIKTRFVTVVICPYQSLSWLSPLSPSPILDCSGIAASPCDLWWRGTVRNPLPTSPIISIRLCTLVARSPLLPKRRIVKQHLCRWTVLQETLKKNMFRKGMVSISAAFRLTRLILMCHRLCSQTLHAQIHLGVWDSVFHYTHIHIRVGTRHIC